MRTNFQENRQSKSRVYAVLRRLLPGLGLAWCGVFSFALAQTAPDAGRLQRELEASQREPERVKKSPAPFTLPLDAKPLAEQEDAPRILVKSFRVSGNLAVPAADLGERLRPWVGRELSMANLMQAVQDVTQIYRDRGYILARAYLPSQEVNDGVIEIAVLEGRLDRVVVQPQDEVRIRDDVLVETIRNALPEQGQIRVDDLDHGLRILNDLPGLDVRSLLVPGEDVGTTAIHLEVEEGPLISGLAGVDNQGGRYTGSATGYASFDLNDPSGRGDQGSLRFAQSSGLRYARIGYLVPVGRSGLKLGLAHAHTRYRLCCEFQSLDATGKAATTSAGLTLALHRSRPAHLSASLNLNAKKFLNRTGAGVSSDKTLNSLDLGLDGALFQGELRNTQSRFRASVTLGRVNLDGWQPDRDADRTTARTHGDFAKADWHLSHLRPLGAVDLFAAFSGQLASKNLDSAEKFSLGGARGVRAYPLGEATGDEGWLLNLELRKPLGPDWQVSTFIDHGRIRLHKETWPGWQTSSDTPPPGYALSGYGLAVARQTSGLLLRGSLANRMGSNPGRDANGKDSDGTAKNLRLWMELQATF
ncbi:MAG: ShlB/FhaC/HecB family hemolysin secretion/activation protein [Betaproteobacteria bacterium]|nr:ShlB/FhaC/HecB family hemolysin secretion/activation protein [Betaproteobacteria bacterium]